MAGHQQRSSRYSNLLVTVKHETEERSVTEIHSNLRTCRSKNNYHSTFYHPTTIYYNSNHRQKEHFNRPSPPLITQRRSKKYDRRYYHNQQQPIRPLMEIEDNQFFLHHDYNNNTFKQKEPKQRDQYRNLKVELDWDHAFDLEQVELYTTQNDIDNYSLTSINSSSESSFSFD